VNEDGVVVSKNIGNFFSNISPRLSGLPKSLTEVGITVVFTFLPFFFLSVNWRKIEGGNTTSSVSDNFMDFWSSGEIVLPVLGLCGAVTAHLTLNKGYFEWWIHAFAGVLIAFHVLGGGAALFVGGGFSQELNSEIIWFGFSGYGVLALVWLYLANRVRSTEAKPRDSNKSAKKILEDANSMRNSKGIYL
jgi:hypothetical protein